MGNRVRTREELNEAILLAPEEQEEAIIKVVGVGGGGGNAANYIYNCCIDGVSHVAINTDAKSLKLLDIPSKIELSTLGAGANPEKAKNFALNHIEEIKESLKGSELVFITAGLGKGTGTGASPVVGKIAKEMDILTIGVVTLPFKFEGTQHIKRAIAGLKELRKHTDGVLIIANELIKRIHGDMRFSEAFHMADKAIANAICGISSTVTKYGYVGTDMQDVRTILTDSNDILMGVGTESGSNRAILAIRQALNSPLFINNNIHNAKKIIVNYTCSTEHEIKMDEIDIVNDEISRCVGGFPEQIWGTTTDETMGENLRITIIVAGLETISDDDLLQVYLSQQKRTEPKTEEPTMAAPVNNNTFETTVMPQPQVVETKMEEKVEMQQEQSINIANLVVEQEEAKPAKRGLNDFRSDTSISQIENSPNIENMRILGNRQLTSRTFVPGKGEELFVHNNYLNDNVD